MINMNQLRFFCELARQNSFSKAADICCVTQPTLSNAIAQLEDSLSGKLFNRSTRKVSLTAFGKHQLPLAEAVLSAQHEFIESAEAFKNPQTKLLRIGISPLIDMQLLTDVIAPFKNKYPDVEEFYKECYMDDLTLRMEDETIDLAVMPKRELPIHFEAFPLYSEPLYFLPNEAFDSTLEPSSATDILLDEITDETIIVTAGGCGLRDTVNNLFTLKNLNPKTYTGQAISYKIVEDWSGLGIGAGILPKSKLSSENTKSRRLRLDSNTLAMINYEVSYPRHIEQASYVSDFIKFLKEVAPQIIQGRAA